MTWQKSASQWNIIWFAGSEKNMASLTLDGVDVMGERLAEEVHSLFGLLSFLAFFSLIS